MRPTTLTWTGSGLRSSSVTDLKKVGNKSRASRISPGDRLADESLSAPLVLGFREFKIKRADGMDREQCSEVVLLRMNSCSSERELILAKALRHRIGAFRILHEPAHPRPAENVIERDEKAHYVAANREFPNLTTAAYGCRHPIA
jgi:hypothetical protein